MDFNKIRRFELIYPKSQRDKNYFCGGITEEEPHQCPYMYWADNGSYVSYVDYKQLLSEYNKLKANLEKYEWLRDLTCNQLYLTKNDHAASYMTVMDWIEQNPEMYENDPLEIVEKMRDTNTIWTLQIYPRTPIGFCVWNDATLDGVLNRAINSTIKEESDG